MIGHYWDDAYAGSIVNGGLSEGWGDSALGRSPALRAPIAEADIPNSYVATFMDEDGKNTYEFKFSADHTLKFTGELVDYNFKKSVPAPVMNIVPTVYNGAGTWSFKDGKIEVQMVGRSFIKDRPEPGIPVSASLVINVAGKNTSDFKTGAAIPVASKYFGNRDWSISYAPTITPAYTSNNAAKIFDSANLEKTTKQLLSAIGKHVDLNNGSALIESYDRTKFDLDKSVAALEERLSNEGPNYQYKTTIGANNVVTLLKTDAGINSWLKGDATYLAKRLKEMEDSRRLRAVFARTVKVTGETYTVLFYFEIYTYDGDVMHLHFAMGD